MRSPQIQTLHREIEQLPKVKKFLASIERNSQRTSTGYKTSIAYFQSFLSGYCGSDAENIIGELLNKKIDSGCVSLKGYCPYCKCIFICRIKCYFISFRKFFDFQID